MVRYDTVWYDTARHDTVTQNKTRQSTTRHRTTRHDTARHVTARHGTTAEQDTAEHNTTGWGGWEGGWIVEERWGNKTYNREKKREEKNLPGFVGVPPLDSFPVTVSSRVSFVLSRIPMSRLWACWLSENKESKQTYTKARDTRHRQRETNTTRQKTETRTQTVTITVTVTVTVTLTVTCLLPCLLKLFRQITVCSDVCWKSFQNGNLKRKLAKHIKKDQMYNWKKKNHHTIQRNWEF